MNELMQQDVLYNKATAKIKGHNCLNLFDCGTNSHIIFEVRQNPLNELRQIPLDEI